MKKYSIKFQYYPAHIDSTQYIGFVSLHYFLNAQKNAKTKVQKIFKSIQLAEKIGDMKTKAELKQKNLYYFTPCVNVYKKRKYSDIKCFTGLAVLDFDHIDNAYELKEHLFNDYKFIIASWLSPSKKGVKAFVNIPISKDVHEFKQYYYALTEVFEVYDGFDCSNKNAVLPLFQSWDSELLQRDNADLFSDKSVDPKEIKYDSVKTAMPVNVKGKEKLILAIAESSINKIGAPGHPQLRSACIALGGYIASGYISETLLLNHVDYLISVNSYLRKGVSGYKKTARWAINQGKKTPLTIYER